MDREKTGEAQDAAVLLSRGDFLKNIGVGIGAAGLASVMGANAVAAEANKGKYVVVVTHGGNDPNRAVLALILAAAAQDKGWGEVHVWMTLEGADLANKTKAPRIDSPIFKKFGNAHDLMHKLKEKGASFGVCPPCAEYMGALGPDKYDFVEKRGGDWLLKNIQDAWVVWM